MRISLAAAALAVATLAACDVSYRSDDGNASVRASRNEATGRLEADVQADGQGIRAELGNGTRGEISVGDGTSLNYSDGNVRANIRTDDNRSISVTSNRD